MNKLSKEPERIRAMFASIAERYDLANTALSFGVHHFWKARLVRELLQTTSDPVLDLCCGSGDLALSFAKQGRRVVGADFCLPMLEVAKKRRQESGTASDSPVQKLELLEGDGLNLPFASASFGAISLSFGLRNFNDTERGLRECLRVLKPGGTLFVLEFGQPTNPIIGIGYRLYQKYGMPWIGALLTGKLAPYRYLPESSNIFPCGQQMVELQQQVGFKNCSTRSLFWGVAYLYCGQKEL